MTTKTKKINNKQTKHLPIGQTLETKDCYLPVDKKHSKNLKDSRPVIIADKLVNPQGEEEYALLVGSREKTPNTSPYNKYGIKNIRHNLEVCDNENKPIKQNNKFRKTDKCSKLPESEVNNIRKYIINHTKFSSENREKYDDFKNRYKKSKR